MIAADLVSDLRRFFALAAPDTGRARALDAGDGPAIAGYLLPYVTNGNAAEKRHARALLRRLDAAATPAL